MKWFKVVLSGALLAGTALLAGCWDKKELNEVAVVIGVGVDKGEDGEFSLTAQVIKPPAQKQGGGGSGGAELPTWSVNAQGKTIMDAVTELNRISPRRLYWPHLQIIIFGEALAKDGIAPTITWFERDRDSRSSTFVAVTRGTAEDLLNQKIELGNVPAKAMSDLIGNAQIRQLPARQMTMRQLTEILSTPGVDAALDIIDPKEIRGKVETYVMAGAALLRGDRLVGYVTDEAVHGIGMANNVYKNASIVVACPNDENAYVTFQVTDFERTLQVKARGGRVQATFDMFVEGNVIDQTCAEELLTPEKREEVEKLIADKMDWELVSMFKQAAEAGSDVYGIGRELRRHDPRAWRALRDGWHERLKYAVDVRTKIDANIRRAGLVVDPTIRKMED